MIPEPRFTQIEKLLESAVKLSHSNTAKIDPNTEAIDNFTHRADRLIEPIGVPYQSNNKKSNVKFKNTNNQIRCNISRIN